MELEFFASCLSGLEQPLGEELKSFGINRVRPLGGGVAFFCEAEKAYRACLWSRIASRIMLVLGRVNAGDAELLYAGAYDIAWETIIAAGSPFNVRATGTNESLRNTRFTSLKVKDAIADRLRAQGFERPHANSDAPRAAIDVRVHDRRATISLDFSGEALNHRSYFTSDDGQDAALACSLAAGALTVGGWPDAARAGAALVDPACRDGILIVEAAAMACDAAAGLDRNRWGFMSWADHDSTLWNRLVAEARQRLEVGLTQRAACKPEQISSSSRPDAKKVHLVGISTSSPAIAKAREHVRRAGLRSVVSIELGDAECVGAVVERAANAARRAFEVHEPTACAIACNIDARSRADARAYVQADETTFAAGCSSACKMAPDANAYCFIAIGAESIASRLGLTASKSIVAGKGRIETPIDVFDSAPIGGTTIEIPDLAGGAPHPVEVLEKTSEQFAARLRKVFKERRKWASRAGVSCYRIYDSDLPDYAVAIDWYTGAGDARGNNYLHISEYAPPASVDAARAQRRFNDVLAISPIVCGIRPDHVFSKRRLREKGGGQYRNAGSRAYPTTIEEGGHLFEIDLAGRLDTGLFLDHRMTRELVGELAQEKRFLNLFAYTGSASVYAASGGATETTTVDLSQTYLDWAQRNMEANGFTGANHAFVRADVLRWITDTRRSKHRFDLIFVDPPTFSNSKAMGKKTWDVQRDHVELLIGVAHLLARGGEAIFSCNLRSFKPDIAKLEKYGVQIEDISADTIPPDFARTPKIHKCYRVRRT